MFYLPIKTFDVGKVLKFFLESENNVQKKEHNSYGTFIMAKSCFIKNVRVFAPVLVSYTELVACPKGTHIRSIRA